MEYLWCFAQFGKICTILKNVKNTQGGVLLIVKLWAVLKAALLHGCFSQMVPNCVKRLICSSRYKNSELPQSMLRLKKTFSLTHTSFGLGCYLCTVYQLLHCWISLCQPEFSSNIHVLVSMCILLWLWHLEMVPSFKEEGEAHLRISV